MVPVPLNYLSNFWRTIEMPLINCEMSKKCILVTGATANHVPKFKIIDTNFMFQ